mgnify:FL=1
MWLNLAAFIIILMLGGLLYQMRVLTQMMSKNLMSQNILDKVDDLQKLLERKGKVTDPFVAANKTHTVGASSQHIIIRKTPDQIRNENYQKIKEDGASYGSN